MKPRIDANDPRQKTNYAFTRSEFPDNGPAEKATDRIRARQAATDKN
jgi:hypothetical protein